MTCVIKYLLASRFLSYKLNNVSVSQNIFGHCDRRTRLCTYLAITYFQITDTSDTTLCHRTLYCYICRPILYHLNKENFQYKTVSGIRGAMPIFLSTTIIFRIKVDTTAFLKNKKFLALRVILQLKEYS